jgi:hypothetical protein
MPALLALLDWQARQAQQEVANQDQAVYHTAASFPQSQSAEPYN